MLKKVCEIIKKEALFEKNAHVVLGLSGGPDSMCLFDLLCRLAPQMNLTIHPVHINHKFRPGAAEEDQAFVEKVCKERGWPCRTFVYDCNAIAAREHLTSEEAGRKVRYEAFLRVAEEILQSQEKSIEKTCKSASDISEAEKKPVVIAVAQNSEDQAETILFRILRGTGTDGLAGIAYKRFEKIELDGKMVQIPIVRPLREISRSEIEAYCQKQNLNPRIDHTNKEAIYARNKIRLQLIPYLEEHFSPNIVSIINRMGKISAMDKDFISHEAELAFESCALSEQPSGSDCDRRVALYTKPLANLHPSVKFRVYNLALESIGIFEGLTMGQLETVEKVRVSEKPSASAQLTKEILLSKIYDKLLFSRCYDERQSGIENLRPRKISAAEYLRLKEEATLGVHGVFQSEELPEPEKLSVRTRQKGDYIMISGADGNLKRKKLQDFLVDEKVPKMYRDEIKLLAWGNQILWVLPSPLFTKPVLREKGRFSGRFRECFDSAKDIKKDIIILEIPQKM